MPTESISVPVDTVAAAILRRLNFLTVATVVVGLMVVGVGVFAWVKADEASSQADRANAALCALRIDLQSRVANSRDYLRHHPHGAPGIPARAIRVQVIQQQHTILSLSALHCPKGGRRASAVP